MALRPISVDIVSLIVDSLIHDLYWPERAKLGGTISLVCRDWRALGEMLRWQRIEITLDEDEWVIGPLIERPQLPGFVQSFFSLKLTGAVVHALTAHDGGPDITSFPILIDLDKFPLEERLTAFSALKPLKIQLSVIGGGVASRPYTPVTRPLRLASLVHAPATPLQDLIESSASLAYPSVYS
ncbi:hypothetical protein Rt10032_c11g4482 [Rhodotorula toruloides]|uniref:Uncharacterized protein n=1 Tax=Rhodotorula toruloides TaxID=5286 RepID=A0A511KKL3_RHOTO|nr:hypothetical protein Rt10032_c11g4482 [Rhodotorula toruloides]